jgi:hypothetical protein
MESECQAQCSRCERGASKIYHPEYICADCKIELLEYKVEDKVKEIARMEIQMREYMQVSEMASQYKRYKTAFETLVSELKKGDK